MAECFSSAARGYPAKMPSCPISSASLGQFWPSSRIPDSPASKLVEASQKLGAISGVGSVIAADRIFGLLERDFSVPDIERAVGDVLRPPADVDLRAHRILLDLCRNTDGKVRMVTTNFDLLFKSAAPKATVWTPARLPQFREIAVSTASFTSTAYSMVPTKSPLAEALSYRAPNSAAPIWPRDGPPVSFAMSWTTIASCSSATRPTSARAISPRSFKPERLLQPVTPLRFSIWASRRSASPLVAKGRYCDRLRFNPRTCSALEHTQRVGGTRQGSSKVAAGTSAARQERPPSAPTPRARTNRSPRHDRGGCAGHRKVCPPRPPGFTVSTRRCATRARPG